MIRDVLAQIYAKVPDLECKGKCWHSCGPIGMSRIEHDRMVRANGGPIGTVDPETLKCPLLDEDHRCRVYDHRPLICRLWGNVEALTCDHGCVPDRYLTDEEAKGLMHELHTMDPVLLLTFAPPGESSHE